MRYISMILRVLIVVVGFKMMALSGRTIDTPPFFSGIGFVAIGLYITIQAMVGPKATLCPLVFGNKGDGSCGK